MFMRGDRSANPATGNDAVDAGPPSPYPDQSQSTTSYIANVVQGITTAGALLVGALWVIEMRPAEEPALPIRVDSWEPKRDEVRSDRPLEQSLTIFLVATEERARRIDMAIEQASVEIAILEFPMFRYEIVVIPSHEISVSAGYSYPSGAGGSAQVSEGAVQVVDLRDDH